MRSAALLVALWCCCSAQRIDFVSPRQGSSNGATRLTISGDGFAQERQFQLNPQDDLFGNRVTLVSDAMSVPCDVERDSTHGGQIMCYTRAMPQGQYVVHVSVDGQPIPDSSICNGQHKAWQCSFYSVWYRTPTITYLGPVSGAPGSVVTLYGRIYTDVYGSNTRASSNGLDVRFLRAYMGGMPCEMLKPESDDLYRLELDSESSQWGHMSCRMTGTYVGHHNLSYILDADFGRSLPDKSLLRVSSLGKLSMFQTFAEVTGVSPAEGSGAGGTLLAVHGRFFDQTDQPARVLVGGQPCEVQTVSDSRITCLTPEPPADHLGLYPGGRGLKMEVWNDTVSHTLSDIGTYTDNSTGYWWHWLDSLPHRFPLEFDRFSTRTSGFLVPPATGNFTIYLHCDDRCELYLSNSTRPEHKARVAFQPYYVGSHGQLDSQKSQVMHLQGGSAYYLELLQMEYGGRAHIDLGLFQEQSPFTREQTLDALNEVQHIVADYQASDEEQVLTFDSWSPAAAVREVQRLTVSCLGALCGSASFSLSYGDATTGPVPVGASAAQVEAALNDLWSIRPDSVQVARQEAGQVSHYTVTFSSDRGDFGPLGYEVFGLDANISVAEVTKGRSSKKTFTLLWGGVPTKPIAFNATESEVKAALEDLMKPECPAEILTPEGTGVKYFNDFEKENSQFNTPERGTPVKNSGFCGLWSLKNAEVLFMESYTSETGEAYGPVSLDQNPTLCFAYKGLLMDEVEIKFTYRDTSGQTITATKQISTPFNRQPQ